MNIPAPIENYRHSINPPYQPKDLISILGTLFVLIALPLTVLANLQFRTLKTKAADNKNLIQTSKDRLVASNEILIKVKKAAKNKVKVGNVADTGIAKVNEVGKSKKIKSFKKLVEKSRKGNQNAEISSWFKVTLDGPAKKIKLDAKRVNGKLKLGSKEAVNLQAEIDELKKDNDIEAVEPNYFVQALAVPNDPFYSSTGSWGQIYSDLWGIHKVNPEAAWNLSTGSASVVVAVIDTGVDRTHPDLASNMWTNSGEVGATAVEGAAPNCTSRGLTLDKSCNNIDDDANGFIDDYQGWDFANSDNNPTDDFGHGTHVAGTIAAVGNNGLGVVGINWTSKIMSVKFLDQYGSATMAEAADALKYAADMGAQVSSNSWGCPCQSQLVDDALAYEHSKGMVVVAAAGNDYGSDALDISPANDDEVITVGATDAYDSLAVFSNVGDKVDVVAPGVDILSARASINPMCSPAATVATYYCRVSGTSMATPHVAGLAALLLAKYPTLTNEEIRQLIRAGAFDLGTAGKDGNFGFGRIDVSSSMNLGSSRPLSPYINGPVSRSTISGTVNITGLVPGPNFASYKVEYGVGREPASWTLLNTSTSQPLASSILASFNTATLSDGLYEVRLTATTVAGKSYEFQVNDLLVNNLDATIATPYNYDYYSRGSLTITGNAKSNGSLTFASYSLQWGVGSSPVSWSSAGISLANSGTTPVTAGTLGTWDTTSLVDYQQYSLLLQFKRVVVRLTLTVFMFTSHLHRLPIRMEL